MVLIIMINALQLRALLLLLCSTKPEPIMLLILPIILSRISHNFHPLFFIYSHTITYYSILFLKFDCVTCKFAYGN